MELATILYSGAIFLWFQQRKVKGGHFHRGVERSYSSCSLGDISISVGRDFLLGANGVLVVSRVGEELYKMSVFNTDGCMSPSCGNRLRCVALYLHKKKGLGLSFLIANDSGDIQAEIIITQNKQYYVKINLGTPSPIAEVSFNFKHNQKVQNYLTSSSIYSCQIGNDHLIIFLEQKQFQSIARNNAFALITKELIGTDFISVNFCCVQSSKDLRIVTYQCGAGVTMACGTGSSVSAYVGFSTGRLQNEVNDHTKGGTLIITNEKEQKVEIFLNGPAKLVFTGSIEE